MVVCVINFGFLDELYTDVIPLQDALIWKELIYTLPVKNAYLSSNDGKRLPIAIVTRVDMEKKFVPYLLPLLLITDANTV